MSALLGHGIEELWSEVKRFQNLETANGHLQERRKQQASFWMWERIDSALKSQFKNHPAVQHLLPEMSVAVNQGSIAPSVAARRLLEAMKS
jgi:LAO/AO transport system kinase